MNITTIILLLLIGMLAGVFGGLFGLGGGIIMIPAMVYLLGVDQQTAQGTSLAVMLPPIGLLAAYNYYKAGDVNIWYAILIAVTFLIGGYFGSKIALAVSEVWMRRIFGILLILIALKMIFSRQAGVVE